MVCYELNNIAKGRSVSKAFEDLKIKPVFYRNVAHYCFVERKKCKTADFLAKESVAKVNHWILFISTEGEFHEAKTLRLSKGCNYVSVS